MAHRPAGAIVACFAADPATLGLDRHLLHDMHWWSAEGKSFAFVARTLYSEEAAAHLASKGATVAPSPKDHNSQVGPSFANHPAIPASHGVLPSDTAFQACAKIAKGAGWPAIEPTEF